MSVIRSASAILFLTAAAATAQSSALAPAQVIHPRLVVQANAGIPDVLAFSPDGTIALTSKSLWEVSTGMEIRRFASQPGIPFTSVFSPDGKQILSAGRDSLARIWDVSTGKLVREFKGHTGNVTAAVFSADGDKIATASFDKTARLWDAKTGAELQVFKGHTKPLVNVVISADGSLIATGGNDNSARIWDASTGQERMKFEEKGAFGERAIFLNPQATKAILRDLNSMQMVDLATGTTDWKKRSSGRSIVSFSADGKEIFDDSISGFDSRVGFSDAATGKPLRTIDQAKGQTGKVVLSRDGTLVLASGGSLNDGGAVGLYDAKTGKKIREFRGYMGRRAPLFSPDIRKFLTWSAATQNAPFAILWDTATGRELHRFAGEKIDGNYYDPNAVAFSPDGAKLFVSSGVLAQAKTGHTSQIFDTDTGKLLGKLKTKGRIRLVRFSPDGTIVATVGDEEATAMKGKDAGANDPNNVVRLWDVSTGEERHALVGNTSSIQGIGFSPDGKRIVGDKKMWDTETGVEIPQNGLGGFIAFAPDGQSFLAGGEVNANNVARIWDLPTNKKRFSLQEFYFLNDPRYKTIGNMALIRGLDMSADGKTAIVSCSDATWFWDTTTGKRTHKLFSGGGTFASLSDDGKYAFTTAGPVTRLWDVAKDRELCSLVALVDGTWISLTRDGRFDGNDIEAIKGLHWVMPDEPLTPLPLEIFMRDYFEPRLLHRLVGGEQLKAVRPLDELNRVQPLVSIAKIEPQPGEPDEVIVTITVEKQVRTLERDGKPAMVDSGAFDLQLFRDGQLVGYSPSAEGPIALDPKTGAATLRFEHIRLPSHRSEVEFSAYAFNADRVRSKTAKRKHERTVAVAPRKGNAYVVCVGVNAFENRDWDLRYAVPDALAMAKTLDAQLRGSGQFEKVVVVTLTSEAALEGGKRTFTKNTATKAHIRAAIDVLAGRMADPKSLAAIPGADRLQTARPDDLVLLTFSTHGDNGPGGLFYLLPSDIEEDHLKRAISTDELSLWLRDVDAGEMVMVVDACHSAASVEQEGFKPGPMGSRGLGQLAYNKRMRILAASQAADVAFEDPRLGHGLLTYALCQVGLKESKADIVPADGKITLGEWLRFGVRHVPQLADDIAAGKTRAVSGDGRDLKAAGERGFTFTNNVATKSRTIAQRPSLFDFTRGEDTVTLRK